MLSSVDPTQPEQLAKLIVSNAEDEIRGFTDRHSQHVLELSENLAKAFGYHNRMRKEFKGGSDREVHVFMNCFFLLDGLVSAMRLLAMGQFQPAAVSVRAALEAAAIATLCAEVNPVKIPGSEERKNFLQGYLENKPFARPHRALKTVKQNQNESARADLAIILEADDHYSQMSHATRRAAHSKVVGGGELLLLGGGHHPELATLLDNEVRFLVYLSSEIYQFIDTLRKRVLAVDGARAT